MTSRPVALVTGGCRRLGAAIAIRLAEAGWDLALHSHNGAAPEPALTDALARAGAAWHVFAADFADPAAAAALLPRVVACHGRAPRLLVNNAALFGQDQLETTTAEALAGHFAVNTAAPALLIRHFAAMRDGDGADRAIVNILDQRIFAPHRDQFAYTLAKVALGAVTRIAADTLGPDIRVNGVAPGLTLPTDDYDPAMMRRLAGMMPLSRLPTPGDVADAVLYAATARGVTGQVLMVDGGAHLRPWSRDFMHLAAAMGAD